MPSSPSGVRCFTLLVQWIVIYAQNAAKCFFYIYIYIYIKLWKAVFVESWTYAHILKRGNRRFLGWFCGNEMQHTHRNASLRKKKEFVQSASKEVHTTQHDNMYFVPRSRGTMQNYFFFSFVVFSSLRLNQTVYCLK